MQKLTVIIVNYNVKFYLEQCLRSVEKAIRGIDAEVCVVDNHSSDGSVEYISRLFPTVKLIASNHNNGFAYANNQAIRNTESEYVLLLNPDTIVGENVLREALSFMDEHADSGAVGVRMLNMWGQSARESRRGLPTPMTAVYKMLGLCNRYPHSKRFARYYMGHLPWDEAAQIDIVSGAFFLVRRAALDAVGLLDEDFFMYGEDIDLSYRLLKAGWKNWYLPLNILHYKGESTEKSSFRYVHVFYKAMLIFFRKHFGGFSLFISIPVQVAIYGKATFALIANQMRMIKKSLGFFARRDKQKRALIYIGSPTHKESFAQLAMRHDLKILPTQCSNDTKEPRLALQQADCAGDVTMVCDAETYSYESILQLLTEKEIKNADLGTYYPSRQILITTQEVYT